MTAKEFKAKRTSEGVFYATAEEFAEAYARHKAIAFLKFDDRGDRLCRNIPDEDYERHYDLFEKQALKE